MKILNILIIILLLSVIVVADSGVYDDVNHNENDIYNLSYVNASYFVGDGSSLTGVTVSTANYSSYANSSTYWGDYDNYTDFQSLLSILWSQLTGVPTLLSNFSDDLGDRGYTVLSNFTDDLGDRGYDSLSNFSDDVGYFDDIVNFTGTLTDNKWCKTNTTHIICDVEPVSDTTYTAGNKLYLSSTEFNVNDTEINSSIEAYGYSTTTGTVTSIGTTAPISGGTITSTGTISLDTATPSDGDTTHASTADQIYDWVIGLGYSTTTGTVTSVATDDTYLTGGAITSTGTITFNETLLNTTIDARDTDTTYTAGAGMTLTGTEFNTTYITNQDTGTGDGVTFSSAQLTSALTVANGGTGVQSFTDGALLFGAATGAIEASAQLPAGAQIIGIAEGTNPALVVTFTAHDGFLKHEFGGLEADVSGYTNGLYGVASGTTTDIDTLAELNTAISDATLLKSGGTLTNAKWCVYDGSGIDCNVEPVSDTTYSAGNGISLSTTTFSVAGNTALTQDADGLSVTADAIGDTQLAFNTGQHLTTTSNPTFNNQTITDCIIFASGGMLCSGT